MLKNNEFEGKTILVTGSPGFIGSHLVLRLLKEMKTGTIISLDNLNSYYNTSLKDYRLKCIDSLADKSSVRHVFVCADLADKSAIDEVFSTWKPDIAVNLAGQAGVRYSVDNPQAYLNSNVIGFMNILEACRHHPVQHLVYASSSSVYGNTDKIPFSTDMKVDQPVSLYAATKASDELLAHSYAKVFNIPSTGLRLFTVYGPAGRPDMFYYSATEDLVNGKSVRLFNYGNCDRDYTYIDDIVEGILRVMARAPEKKNGADGLPIAPHAVYNIGGGKPVNLMEFIKILQEELVRAGLLPEDYDFSSHHELVPMQPGDVAITYADTTALERDFGYRPETSIREGLRAFVEWFKQYR